MIVRHWLALAALGFGLPAWPAFAGTPIDDGPGASLVFPYVEVDLDDPDGRTTTFSIGNVGRDALAHVVLWSDWGSPAYAWDVYLKGDGVLTYNLRDLLTRGFLPPSGGYLVTGANHCTDPITHPALGGEALAALQKKLTGQPDAAGTCSSEPRSGRLATGVITVDLVRDCSYGGVDDPRDDHYFRTSDPVFRPLAEKNHVLWGDFYLIDPAENLAEGYEAFTLKIDRSPGNPSFWGNEQSALRRQAPGNCSRLRFLRGGPFAARTSVLFFAQRLGGSGATGACSVAAGPPGQAYDVYSEAGEKVLSWHPLELGRRLSARLEVGTEIPTELQAGFLQVYAFSGVGAAAAPTPLFLAGTIEARGRFATGTKGLAVARTCLLP